MRRRAGEELLRRGEGGEREGSREGDGSEGRFGGWCVVDVFGYEEGHGCRGDVLDYGEGGEEDDGCRFGVV